MKSKNLLSWLCALTLLSALNGFGQTIYNQYATNLFNPSLTNAIEKSATTDLATAFKTDIATAWTNNTGGVFSFASAVATGTTVYRALYGANTNGNKRLSITSSVSMQNVTSGSFYMMSAANATCSSANQSDYTLTLALQDATTGLPLGSEIVKRIGFVILSRAAPTAYPLDLKVTATYSDASTQMVTANIANGAGVDDTFFGFTAPDSLAITSVRFQSFQPGTSTPVADRIGFDDFGIITAPATTVPAPQVINVTPIPYALTNAAGGIHFQALTYEAVNPANISLVLNSVDVTAQLVFTGDPTNYSIAYNGLADNQQYTMTISVTNSTGVAVVTRNFNTANSVFTIFDSQSFASDIVYPLGNLLALTNGAIVWTPNTNEPAQITDVGGTQGKVLQRQNTGATRADVLSFPPISSGTVYIDFDVSVSTTTGRTLDLALQPPGGSMASFLAWGEVSGKLAYFDNTNWLPITDITTDWAHIKIINYLSGPAAGKYDVLINGSVVAQRLSWRNSPVGTAFSLLRIESANTGPIFQYSSIDNLIITAGPQDTNAFPAPQISGLSATNYTVFHPTNGISFNVLSSLPVASSNVIALLDGTNISGDLAIVGTTNLAVSYNLLGAGLHNLSVTAINSTGSNSVTSSFIAASAPFTLYDSGGFADNSLYPAGALQAISNNVYNWTPDSNAPSQIIDLGDAHGKVLRRSVQAAADRIDYLKFQPLINGLLTIDADVRISTTNSRVLDMAPMQPTGNNMASFIGWGTATNYFAWFSTPSNAWLGLTILDTNWHHYTTINYLSGPFINTFDLVVDGVTIGSKLPFKTGATPISRLRLGAIRGTADGEYGDVDNLTVTVGNYIPAPNAASLTTPSRSGANAVFSFASQSGFTHVVEYKTFLSDPVWNFLQSIPGDGSVKTVTNSLDTNTKFYRVRTY